MHTSFHITKPLYYLLLFAAFAWFVWRGPIRMLEVRDSLCPFLGSRLFTEGKNPYDKKLLEAARVRLVHESGDIIPESLTLAIYPPTTLIILSFVSWLNWDFFRYLLLIINTAGLLAVIFILQAVARIQLYSLKALVLWTVGLIWAPWHSGMATGNLTLPAISIGILGWGATEFNRNWCAGIFLFLSLMLKPQIGGLFLFAIILGQNWRLALFCLLSWGGSSSLILGWMHIRTPEWWGEYKNLANNFLVLGGENDPSQANYLRHDLINLQRLFYTITENQQMVRTSVIIFTCALLGWIFICHRNKNNSQSSLLTVALITAAGLLPVYHRFYDASLLLLALAWGLGNLEKNPDDRRLAIAVLVGCVAFLMPGAAFFSWAVKYRYVYEKLANTWYWESIIMSHQVWALLLITVSLSVAMTKAFRNKNQII